MKDKIKSLCPYTKIRIMNITIFEDINLDIPKRNNHKMVVQ